MAGMVVGSCAFLSIKGPSVREFATDIGGFAKAKARLLGFSPERAEEVGACAVEAVMNAVKHGNRFQAVLAVRVDFLVETTFFTIRVNDQGEGFDPKEIPDPTSDENRLKGSGRGIRTYFDNLADEWEVSSLPGVGATVSLRFFLPLESERSEEDQTLGTAFSW